MANQPLFIKRALRWGDGPFDKNFFYRFLVAKANTHILTKIGEKNRVLSGIGSFDN